MGEGGAVITNSNKLKLSIDYLKKTSKLALTND